MNFKRLILCALALIVVPAFAEGQVKKIRWVLAHDPVKLFEAAANHFAEEVGRKTNGQIQVEILTVPAYGKAYTPHNDLKKVDVVRYIQDGKIEMSQTYTTSLGLLEKDMYVLDLPFLFRDHGHAEKVLEGKVGNQLLAGLEKSNVHGLAFTYSGGYRILPGNTPIEKIEQFKGMKIRTSQSPVAQDTFTQLGATPVVMGLDDVANAAKRGQISAAESTYPRFYELKQNEFSKVLNDTQHSLFLTSIVINQDFWKSLTPAQQQAVREAAVSAARLERKQSIADAEVTKEQCKKDGIQVVSLPKAEQEKFKTLMQPIYKKYENYFSNNLIGQIQKD